MEHQGWKKGASPLRRLAAGVLVSVLVAGGLTACGHGPQDGRGGDPRESRQHGGPGERHERRHEAPDAARALEGLARDLSLDAAQKQRLDTLSARLQAMHPGRGQPGPRPAPPSDGRAPEPGAGPMSPTDLQALVAGARFDSARALAQVDAHLQARRLQQAELITAAAAFFDSLQPAQQQKVREWLAQLPRPGEPPQGGPRHGDRPPR
ncbi:hypothetical protein C7444_11799 [Sphaerotilus hippei]|uniref:LTXXQ motif family protein n=1 Tax=Sphaerotilus hippei TaxID=744406 RepID=A0A318H4E9_9BURK|nr:hypothetical protein [Sphaerotilus hippei]PXW93893.1 hypothetical protein C7444_11799 [Sphaerotilus hippei]